MGSNEKKSATLGMPHGTAMHRLRKNILFVLLSKTGDNVCVRCKKLIDSVDDLSIEHIKPWEGISAELFWDLQNIAFSHLRCNRPHTIPGGASLKTVAPEGQSWCSQCESFKSVDDFHNQTTRWNGLSAECIVCKSARNILRNRKSQVSILEER